MNDYRYFPEPDLAPFSLSDSFIAQIRESIPALQEERIKKYTTSYQLSAYDAGLLTEERELSDYFEQVIHHTGHYKYKTQPFVPLILQPHFNL